MATGTLEFFPEGAGIPDGSSGNAAPAISRQQGTEANPKKHFFTADFDAATDEFLWFRFMMPTDYSSGGVVKLAWFANATTGTARWGTSIGAVTAGDTDTPLEHANAGSSTAGTATNATEANRLNTTSITLANLDSVAAGDLCFLMVQRDADGTSGTDDLSVDAKLTAAVLEYTTV